MKIVNKPLKEHYEMDTDSGTTLAVFDYINDLEIYTEFLESQVKKLSLGVVVGQSEQLKDKKTPTFEEWMTKNKIMRNENGWLVYKREEHSRDFIKYKYEEAMKSDL